MCHACILEGAKRGAPSRRRLFTRAAALGAANIPAGAAIARPLLAPTSGHAAKALAGPDRASGAMAVAGTPGHKRGTGRPAHVLAPL